MVIVGNKVREGKGIEYNGRERKQKKGKGKKGK